MLSEKVQEQLNHKEALLVATMQKSGTYWLLSLLGQYIHNSIIQKEGYENISIEKFKTTYLRNYRVMGTTQQYKDPNPDIKKIGFTDIIYQHVYPFTQDIHHFLGKKIVLHRNPLDFIVSSYYYFDIQDNRSSKHSCIPSLNNAVVFYAHEFSRIYAYINALQKQSKQIYSLSYEQLKKDTKKEFSSLIKWLDLSLDESLVDFSINEASIKNVKKFEQEKGKLVTHEKGTHVRSGLIGQWKTELTSKQVNTVRNILKQYEIHFDEFILE